jgi:hypothetical protein
MATVICSNCETENPDTVKFCKQCGNSLATATIVTPVSPVAYDAARPVAPPEKRYSALRGIAALCKTLAIVFAALAVLTGILTFIGLAGDSFFAAVGGLIGALISAAVVYIFWRVIGESISVLLDIEENTRRSADRLENQ